MPKGKKKKEVAAEEQKDTGFEVSFIFPDKTYVERADTILEALEKFNLKIIKGKAILKAEKDGKKAEQLWYPHKIRQLLSHKGTRQLTEKRFLLALR